MLDQLMEEGRRERSAVVSLVLENDLRQRDGREVLAARGVHDGDFLAAPDHLLDFFKGDVPALLRVVQLTVRIPLDDVRHGVISSGEAENSAESNTARQAGQATAC
jgi:hypothetical protein